MTTESIGKTAQKEGSSASRSKSAPLISRKLLLFMVAMVLANTGGNMYGPLLPLYLKELDASVIQIGMFFYIISDYPTGFADFRWLDL